MAEPIYEVITDDELRSAALLVFRDTYLDVEEEKQAETMLEHLRARCEALDYEPPVVVCLWDSKADIATAIDDAESAQTLIDALRRKFNL